MYFLAYLSNSSPKITEDDLINILIESRRRNIGKAITGMLLYIEGNIIQVIEGVEHDVIQLFSKIEQDNRHYGIVKIAEGEIDKRNFEGWAMGFKSTSFDELENFTSFKNISRETFLSEEQQVSDHPAIVILKNFYENYNKGQS